MRRATAAAAEGETDGAVADDAADVDVDGEEEGAKENTFAGFEDDDEDGEDENGRPPPPAVTPLLALLLFISNNDRRGLIAPPPPPPAPPPPPPPLPSPNASIMVLRRSAARSCRLRRLRCARAARRRSCAAVSGTCVVSVTHARNTPPEAAAQSRKALSGRRASPKT